MGHDGRRRALDLLEVLAPHDPQFRLSYLRFFEKTDVLIKRYPNVAAQCKADVYDLPTIFLGGQLSALDPREGSNRALADFMASGFAHHQANGISIAVSDLLGRPLDGTQPSQCLVSGLRSLYFSIYSRSHVVGGSLFAFLDVWHHGFRFLAAFVSVVRGGAEGRAAPLLRMAHNLAHWFVFFMYVACLATGGLSPKPALFDVMVVQPQQLASLFCLEGCLRNSACCAKAPGGPARIRT